MSQDSLETPEFLEETDYLDLKETEVSLAYQELMVYLE